MTNPTCLACKGRGYYRSLLTPWVRRMCKSCTGFGYWLLPPEDHDVRGDKL